jgi:hypothetical protein
MFDEDDFDEDDFSVFDEDDLFFKSDEDASLSPSPVLLFFLPRARLEEKTGRPSILICGQHCRQVVNKD